jgi:branched-chain amino acid aminotransferase
MICTMAKHEAEAKGYGDALMLDWRGRIAEATGANIFLVMNGELHTPTPDCFLDGITRQAVIGLARARQLKVIERAILPEELAKTQEVFLTGTAAEITPVVEIGEHRFQVGQISRMLMEDFTRLARSEAAAASAA